MSRERARPIGDQQQNGARQRREREDLRPRAGEGAHLLGPSERRGPPQPIRAARGVSDHPQQQADRDRRAAELEREPPRRRKLADERAHTHEHNRHRRHRQREIRRPRRRQATRDEPRELRSPQQQHARSDPEQRGNKRASARHAAGEHQLAAPAVLLAAQGSHRRQHPERGGRDRQRAADAPSAVPGDGRDPVRVPVEQAQRVVPREAVREADPVRHRRVGVAVPDRLDVGVEREQVRERERPRTPVAKRAVGERRHHTCGEPGTTALDEARRSSANGRHDRPRCRSGAGRSPPGRARG